MEEKDLLSLALAQSSQISSYWTLYIAVTGALIGVLTAEKVGAVGLAEPRLHNPVIRPVFLFQPDWE
jgi:hypothetical protein